MYRIAIRVHPKTWFIFGLSGLLLSFAPLPIGARGMLLVAFVMIFVFAGAFTQFLRFSLVGLLPVALVAWTIQAVSYRGQTIYTSWEPVPGILFNVTAEGLAFGGQMALQILCFGASCSLLSLLISPLGLRSALTSWHLPPRLVYLLCASLNAPRQLGFYADLARETGRARGLADSKLTHRIWLRVRTASALFNLVLLDQEVRGRSLADRGLDQKGPRIYLTATPDSTWQILIRWSVLGASALLSLVSYGVAL